MTEITSPTSALLGTSSPHSFANARAALSKPLATRASRTDRFSAEAGFFVADLAFLAGGGAAAAAAARLRLHRPLWGPVWSHHSERGHPPGRGC